MKYGNLYHETGKKSFFNSKIVLTVARNSYRATLIIVINQENLHWINADILIKNRNIILKD